MTKAVYGLEEPLANFDEHFGKVSEKTDGCVWVSWTGEADDRTG